MLGNLTLRNLRKKKKCLLTTNKADFDCRRFFKSVFRQYVLVTRCTRIMNNKPSKWDFVVFVTIVHDSLSIFINVEH
jgi:hypothetical protein